jgi:polyisoprenoid-binding protein YceI
MTIKPAVACVLLMLPGAAAWAQPATYEIQPSERSGTVQAGRAGLLKFAGHTHEVVAPVFAGQVVVDEEQIAQSSVSVEFDAMALRVSGKGEPADDVPKVQENMMGPKGLDATRHPKVTFRSRAVQGRRASPGNYEVVVTGDLALHGVTHAVVLPLRVEIKGGTLTATGRTTLRHTDFGMKPISVAGVVNVKNELVIDLNIVAQKK